MLKGSKRRRSRPTKNRKKRVSSLIQDTAVVKELSDSGWTTTDTNLEAKITDFFHHVNLDHNYTNQGKPSILPSGISPPVKRPALKPARKCQKSEEISSNKSITDYFPVRRSLRKTLVKMKKEKLKDIEEAIISGAEEGYVVKDFIDKGRGVITTKPLKQGDFVLEYYGDLITRDEAKRREGIYSQDENVGCYMYYFTYNNKSFCVDATRESSRLGRLVNHCKKGNLVTKIFLVKDRPHLILVAKQDIMSGQELLYDYGDRSKDSLEFHPWLAS